MTWLFPAVLSTLIGSVLLSAAYCYLYIVYRRKFLAFWCAAWCIYSLRYVFLLLMLAYGKSTPLYLANMSMISISLYFLYLGTLKFIGKRVQVPLQVAFALILGWTILAILGGFSFLMLTVPLFGFFACVDIWVGYSVLHSDFPAGIGKKIVGLTFIFWGLHQADYPLLRPVEWFAPFGYMIGTTCAVTIALGMLILFFERMRNDLEEQKSRMRQMFDSAPYGIGLADPETGVIVDCNQGFAKMLKLDRAELIGRKQAEFHPPEEQSGTLSTTYRQHLGNESGQTLECRLINSEGQNIFAEVTAGVINLGDRRYMQAFFRDITARKQSEQAATRHRAEFKAIFHSIADGVVFADLQRRIVMINPAFTRMFGYRQSEIAGQLTRILYANQADFERQGEQRFNPEGGNANPEFNLIWRRKDGGTFPGENLGCKVTDEKGNLLGYLGVIRDVSERKHAEQKRLELEGMLQQAYKMEAIGTMAGGIAHDFNNMLAVITGNLEMLQRKHRTGGDLDKNIENIRGATNRATEMVKQILTFSRRSGQELAVLDLLKALNSTVELLRATIPTTVEILCGFGEEPLRIKADRTQLQQVVINLCTNAVHAMDEKGLLRIDLKKTDAAPLPNIVDPASTIGYARLSISDTGIGMNQETLGRIFEPFFTTKEVGKGTGMGLAVAHGIVEQHGGVITVESTPGKGSAFHIYFPLCDEQETEDLDAASALPSGKGESILLVDDEESLVKTSCELLTELGYRVRGTTSSLEALEIFRADPEAFDLVFSDQTMPKLSGVDLAIELLKIKPQTPIILITGYTSKVTEQDAKALGIRAFCEKPLSNQELAELIRKVLD